MKKSEMYCGYCGHTDGMILTSIPPKVKCLITAECHNLGADCNIEFAPIKHGHWIKDGHHIRCSECEVCFCDKDREGDAIPTYYCPNCGARMDEVDNG